MNMWIILDGMFIFYLLVLSFLVVYTCLALISFLIEWSERSALRPFSREALDLFLQGEAPARIFYRKVRIYFKQLITLCEAGSESGLNPKNVILEERKLGFQKKLRRMRRIALSAPLVGIGGTILILVRTWNQLAQDPSDLFWRNILHAAYFSLSGMGIGLAVGLIYWKRKYWMDADMKIMDCGTAHVLNVFSRSVVDRSAKQ